MTRPFSKDSIVELERVFAEIGENLTIMQTLLEEVEHRKTGRANRLRNRVVERLTALKGESKHSAAVTGDLFKGPPLTTSSKNLAAISPVSPGSSASCASSRKGPVESSAPSISDEQPDDRKVPQIFTGIAAPGVKGRPDAYQPALDTDLVIALPQDSTNIQGYVRALDALIGEMRRDGSGSRRYELEQGKVVDTQQGNPIYAFPFSEEAAIFEEARIEIEVNGRRSKGQIVAISEGTILISLDESLGPSIRRCILLIDNTALVEALKDRLDEAGKGELNLSAALADGVVSKGRRHPEVSPIQVPKHELNESQDAALHLMLERSISYLWGPPGTGKTQTLSVAIQAFFDSGKRVLVCSNTNQAVDQIIYKLCRHLEEGTHEALGEGKVVRAGNIVLPELKHEYASNVTTDGIIERLSKELRERQREIEKHLSLIETRATSLRQSLQLIGDLDEKTGTMASISQALSMRGNSLEKATAAHKRAAHQIQVCKTELQERENAGALRRVFLRSRERILRASELAQSDLERQVAIVRVLRDEVNELETKRNGLRSSIETLASQISGQDKKKIARQMEIAERERTPLVSELQEIARRLAELEASIMREARVIGTTVARAYVRARDIGRFDVVVIDEASMVLLPALYFAAGLSTERVIVSGDFRQLPPILPSRQQVIHDLIGKDVFEVSGIDGKSQDPRYALLDAQYRMTDEICQLIATDMYQGRLRTAKGRNRCIGPRPPTPYDGSLTIIDTSKLWPFESRNTFKSRFNLLNALLIRNLVGHFASSGFLNDSSALGVCTPYAAQAKLLQKIIGDMEQEARQATAGTVHRYQGDEKRMMILDIPESTGPNWGIGLFVQGIPPEHVGARLLNVAVSRAKEHLIVVANLTYLDMQLPSTSLLRGILHTAQQRGSVIDASQVMALRPIEADLKDLMGIVELDLDSEKLGLFHSKTFFDACRFDMNRAERSIVIYSGFITPQRLASYGDLFRMKVAEGVAIRCVTRPPQFNGSIPEVLGRQALDALEGIGVVVDCRRDIHEKIVLIDNRVIWAGSLNPLSHTFRTDEFMTRTESEGFAEQVAAFVSKRTGVAPAEAASTVTEAENPRCPDCKSRTWYAEGRYGPYFKCENQEGCGWHDSARRTPPRTNGGSDAMLRKDGPQCPKCGKPTHLRNGPFGRFYGCTGFPKCDGTVNLGGKNRRGETSGTSRRQSSTKRKRARRA